MTRAAGQEVRIRLAETRDEPALARLRTEAERTHAKLLPDYFRVASTPAGPVAAGPAPAGAVVLVATAADDVRGYVALRVVDTPRDPAMTPRRRAHVETVVVDEKHRRRGIGSALMRAAAEWAERRGAAEVVLTVWSDNGAAETLYRRLGYEPIARVLRQPGGH